jgi:hypothetical protein
MRVALFVAVVAAGLAVALPVRARVLSGARLAVSSERRCLRTLRFLAGGPPRAGVVGVPQATRVGTGLDARTSAVGRDGSEFNDRSSGY